MSSSKHPNSSIENADKSDDLSNRRLVREWADALDKSVEHNETVGPEIATQLQQARRKAVAEFENRTVGHELPFAWWQMGGTAAAAAVLVVLVLPYFSSRQIDGVEPLPYVSDVELALAAEEEAELLENLEFVAWMVDQQDEHNGDLFNEETFKG